MTAPITRETADHAELARLAESLAEPDHHDPACPFTVHCYCDDAQHDRISHPLAAKASAGLTALLSEIAALRGEAENARTLVAQANNSLFGSFGYFHGEPFDALHLARPIEGLKDRATQAERQRDEAVGLLREVCIIQNNGDLDARIFRLLANQGADQ